MTTLIAVGEDVIVERKGPYYAEHSALFIPTFDETVDRTAPEIAEVISVGPRVKEAVIEGDRVLIGRYGGDFEFEVGDREYTRCRVSDLLVVLL